MNNPKYDLIEYDTQYWSYRRWFKVKGTAEWHTVAELAEGLGRHRNSVKRSCLLGRPMGKKATSVVVVNPGGEHDGEWMITKEIKAWLGMSGHWVNKNITAHQFIYTPPNLNLRDAQREVWADKRKAKARKKRELTAVTKAGNAFAILPRVAA